MENWTNIKGPKVQIEDASRYKQVIARTLTKDSKHGTGDRAPSVHGSWTSPIGRSSLDPHISHMWCSLFIIPHSCDLFTEIPQRPQVMIICHRLVISKYLKLPGNSMGSSPESLSPSPQRSDINTVKTMAESGACCVFISSFSTAGSHLRLKCQTSVT